MTQVRVCTVIDVAAIFSAEDSRNEESTIIFDERDLLRRQVAGHRALT